MCFQTISKLIMAALCSTSLLITPSKAAAVDYCCQSQDECCDSGCGWGRTALLVGGAVVSGGIAGAIAGNSHKSHHGHSGNCGSCGSTGSVGPVGPAGPTGATGATGADAENTFVVDECADLAFIFTTPTTADVSFPLTTIAGTYFITVFGFVSTPDGQVFSEEFTAFITVPVTGTGGTLTILTQAIEVPAGSVVEGAYHAGIQITNDAGLGLFDLGAITTNVVVDVDNPGCEPTTELVTLDPIITTPITAFAPSTDAQSDTEFTYTPDFF